MDKDTLYVTEKGVLLYLRNDGFKFYLYKEHVEKFICLEFHNIVNPYRGKFETLKNGELTSMCALACEILDITYNGETRKEYSSSKKSSDTSRVDLGVNCWECGSLLDINGKCDTCGCSSEI